MRITTYKVQLFFCSLILVLSFGKAFAGNCGAAGNPFGSECHRMVQIFERAI